MSDSDDWENAADDILEDKKEESKGAKFADEDNVDSDEERQIAKKKAEEEEAKREKREKVKPKKDYEAMYAERQGKVGAGTKAAELAAQNANKEQISMAAEEDLAG